MNFPRTLPIAGTGMGAIPSRPAAANEADTWIPGARVGTQGDRSAVDLNHPDSTVSSSESNLAARKTPTDPQQPHPMAQLIALLHAMQGMQGRPPMSQPLAPAAPSAPLTPPSSGVFAAPLPLGRL